MSGLKTTTARTQFVLQPKNNKIHKSDPESKMHRINFVTAVSTHHE